MVAALAVGAFARMNDHRVRRRCCRQCISLPNARADSTSVYVAGKGKYCKETAVSGYLDCFYASFDACSSGMGSRHSQSAG